jgi:hypothetical protein
MKHRPSGHLHEFRVIVQDSPLSSEGTLSSVLLDEALRSEGTLSSVQTLGTVHCV